MNTRYAPCLAVVLSSAAFAGGQATLPATNPHLIVSNGQTIAFLGDSITANGWGTPGGYVRLVVDGLQKNGVNVTPIPAGVGGNTSADMIARFDRDVLAKSPDWLTISCGVNDVWHSQGGVSLDAFKKNITSMIDRAQAKGVKVVLLTATAIGEDANEKNSELAGYNDFLRSLAAERKLPLADLSSAVHAVLDPEKPPKDSRILTVDGVHMNPDGNVVMAKGVLRAFGLSQEEVDALEQTWLDQKDTASVIVYPFDPRPGFGITLRQYRALAAIARESHTNSVEMGRTLWLRALAKAIDQQRGAAVIDNRRLVNTMQAELISMLNSPATQPSK